MTRNDEATRVLRQLRDAALETGEPPSSDLLRREIGMSWRRCVLSGVRPEGVATKEVPKTGSDGLLARAAKAVLERRAEQMASSSTGLILADRNGVVLDLWTDDATLNRLLQDASTEQDFMLDESLAGNNGIGTVLMEQRPVQIRGAEHFADAFHQFSCAGVPIRHPITRQLQGVVNVTCRYEDTNGLLMPMALQTAEEIERRLYQASSYGERLLLEQFLAAQKRRNRPLIVLNDQVIISNSAAARVLDAVDQSMLWEQAAQAIGGRETRSWDLTLRTGDVLSVQCSPIEDGNSVVGAIIDIQPTAVPSAPGHISAESGPSWRLSGLAGRSGAWQQLCEQGRRFGDSDVPVVVAGEPGVGKLALIMALFSEEQEQGRLTVVDAALEPIEGPAAWVTRLREQINDPKRVVVLRHLEVLQGTAAQAACGLLDAVGADGARVVATLTKNDEGGSAVHRPLMDRLSVATLTIPPLRDRLGDLPDLLAELTRRHTTAGTPPRWLPDAIQTLSRLEWRANVRELENLVRRVLLTRRSGDIRAEDLPAEIRSQAPRRRLTQLERLECDAITKAIDRAHRNKSEAAELLGISRATLYRKIRSYGIDLRTSVF